jgi:nitrite reductase/ring-hydroxylating ferredoxin subunit
LDEVPDGEARGFSAQGPGDAAAGLIVVRIGDDVRVYENRCPHRGTPLDWAPGRFMDSGREYLVCSTHGALFRPGDGECVAGPCAGEFLKRRAARVEDGQVVLCAADGAVDPPASLS